MEEDTAAEIAAVEAEAAVAAQNASGEIAAL